MLASITRTVPLRGLKANKALYGAMITDITRSLSNKPAEMTPEEEEDLKRNTALYLENKDLALKEVMPDESIDRLPENLEELELLDPLREDQKGRKVIIYQKVRPTTTSGRGDLGGWYVRFRNQESWTNPLMGWTSTADPMAATKIKFDTQDQAEFFCKKRGFKYEIRKRPRTIDGTSEFTYSQNFLTKDVEHELKINGVNTQQFAWPTAGESHYQRPLTYHGTSEARQHGDVKAG